jgi:hypothetical protein
MSIDQRETIKLWSGAFMKILFGISSTALAALYYNSEGRRDYERDELKKTIEKIEVNTTQMNTSINIISNNMSLIEYRLKQVESNRKPDGE